MCENNNRSLINASEGEQVQLSKCSKPKDNFKASLVREQENQLMQLPMNYEQFTDKYFLRALEILVAERLNPWVKGQICIRKGPGTVAGLSKAIAVFEKYSGLTNNNGIINSLSDGDAYSAGDTVMTVEGHIQDFIALETMYLGIIAAATTRATWGNFEIDLKACEENMRAVVSAAEGRPVMYFGARHWTYEDDEKISAAAIRGGATDCSTDVGARALKKNGIGTIPHVLENIFAFYHGRGNAVVEATLAFDRVIDPKIPRIALIDYNNKEISDSINCADALNGKLYAVRVDTCGENIAEGALTEPEDPDAVWFRKRGIKLPLSSDPESRYWYGSGVSVSGVIRLRAALDEAGHESVKIVLTSGFADISKIKAFTEAEKLTGMRLFDSLGVGGIYQALHTKMDIVGVSQAKGELYEAISKIGRSEKQNPKLKRMN